MKKRVAKVCKLQFMAGGARPGPALASAGINMPQFCQAFNDATKDRKGDIVPVIITAYEDKILSARQLLPHTYSRRLLVLRRLLEALRLRRQERSLSIS